MNTNTIENLKVGDVLHCKGEGLMSSVIALCTKSDITHTAIVLENWGKLHVAESHNKKGVISTPLDKWLEECNYEIEVSRPFVFNYKDVNVRANEKMGWVNYPMWKMIWIYVAHYFTGQWRPFDENILWCTMLAIYAHNVRLGWSSPVDLYDYCIKNNTQYKTFKLNP